MKKNKVLKTVTAISDKNGELISAGVVIDKDQLDPVAGERLLKLKAIELVDAEDEDGDDDSAGVFGNTNQNSQREADVKKLSRKSRADLDKTVENMRKDGYTVAEYTTDAANSVVIDAILDAKKAE